MKYLLFCVMVLGLSLFTEATCEDDEHGAVRLVGERFAHQGRVEVCLNGNWGTVCIDGWAYIDSIVVCRQLGYGRPGELSLNDYYSILCEYTNTFTPKLKFR